MKIHLVHKTFIMHHLLCTIWKSVGYLPTHCQEMILNHIELTFCLDPDENYFNFIFYNLGKDAIYTIPVKNILAVEKLEESSFNKKNVSYTI